MTVRGNDPGPWVAPNARGTVAGTELERDRGESMTSDRLPLAGRVPAVPATRLHGMALPPDVEQCGALFGEHLDRCMYVEGHLERHATADGRRFDA